MKCFLFQVVIIMVFCHNRKWALAVTELPMLPLEEWGRLRFWWRKLWNPERGAWKTVVMRAMWTMKAQLERCQREVILATSLEKTLRIILPKNEDAFFPCPKNHPEAKLKHLGLISLAEELPRETNIDSAVWLWEISLLQINNEKEQAKHKETQKVQFEDKMSTGKFHVGATVCAER